MKRNLKIFILFLFIAFSIKANAKEKWVPVKTPKAIAGIIGGNSINDFWLLDNHRTILHFTGSQWKAYPFEKLFSPARIRSYRPILMDNNRLFVLMTESDWKTHIAEIRNGKIIRYSIVVNNPLYRITNVTGTLYATGDFGLILQLKNGRWKKVNSPIHSHIYSAVAGKKGILWLGTSGRGLFSYNGRKFKKYSLPNKIAKAILSQMKIIHDTLYINTSKNISYKMAKGIFYPVPPKQSPFTTMIKLMGNGYYKIVSQNNKTQRIPYLYKIKSFKELGDDHALLLTQNNQLFYDQQVTGNFFLDFASIRGLAGPEYSFVPFATEPGNATNSLYHKLRPGIVFSDFNNDFYQDILLFNVSNERHPFLYFNNQKNYFNNFAGPLGLNNFTFNGFLSYAFDLNGDHIPEIISSDFRNNEYYLNILEKTAGTYHLSASIPIPKKYAVNPLHYLSFTDYDSDGDLDIALVFGYSVSGSGSIIFLRNNGYGSFSEPDTTRALLFKGWNIQTIFADFNNDGVDDIFASRNWGPNIIFFQNKPTGWTIHRLKEPKDFLLQQRKFGTVAFDLDNDGDLDIVTLAEQPFIRILQNDGKGNFTDITEKSGLNVLNSGRKSGQITAGDFDNNGFLDLFITVHSEKTWKNYLFLNDSARRFFDQSEKMGVAGGHLEFVATGDIDNDGDLDIYGFRQGKNILWLNNLDSNNFLRFRLTGIKSNSAAIGTKIWLYEAGHFGDSRYLTGYRQTGSMLTGSNYQNEQIVHFGVNSKNRYDAKIIFPAGKTIILKNLSSGKNIHVVEISPPLSWIYTADNKAHILLRNNEFLSYLTIIVLGLLFLMLTISYGTKAFRWDVRLTTIIVSLNLIIFAVLLIVLYASGTNLKYYLPLGVILLGSFGPIGFFLWIKKFTNLKSEKEKEYSLFKALQNFSHGAWASSNLNSLQLFFENLSAADLHHTDYRVPFEKRKETFFGLTLPVIEEIISLTKNIEANKDIALDIEKQKSRMVEFLSADFSQINSTAKEKLSTAIKELRKSLSGLKNIVFVSHSCFPVQLLEKLKPNWDKTTAANKTKLKISNFLSPEDAALMSATALADILDNCVQNSVKAMDGNKHKELTIKLLKSDPRFFIEVSDNGCGILDEKREQIFENGYSTTNSTGYGLFYAKDKLSKYGGRIYVKTSIPGQRTTFVIELQKGSKK